MTAALRVPDRLANTVVAAFGDVGRAWLARLPDLVAEAASCWQLQSATRSNRAATSGGLLPYAERTAAKRP